MVDTRAIFSNFYGNKEPSWKKRLDELHPDRSHDTTERTKPTASELEQDRQKDEEARMGLLGTNHDFATKESNDILDKIKPEPALKQSDPPTGTLDQELYDEMADLADEEWITKKYFTHQPKPKTLSSDETKNSPHVGPSGEPGQSDQRPEDWTSRRDDPLTKPRKTDAVLSCPCCFTVLCYDCQQ